MGLLNAKEVAEILQVNVQRVYELTRPSAFVSIRFRRGGRGTKFGSLSYAMPNSGSRFQRDERYPV
jgi:hypothetical protein